DQARYNVSGGKAAYAYEAGASCRAEELFPGVEASMRPMPAAGQTSPPAKGVTLRVGSSVAAGEGMGYRVPIVHYTDGWLYSRTFADVELPPGAATRQPTLTGAALGRWVAVQGRWARLRSGSLGVEWSVPALQGAELYGGRELAPPDFNWAGLDYIFPESFAGTTYRIVVQEAR